MILPDVNVLVYAHREDAHDHQAYRGWLESVVKADSAFGLSDLVVSGFVRIVTHPQIFMPPSPLAKAMRFARGAPEPAEPCCSDSGSRSLADLPPPVRRGGREGQLGSRRLPGGHGHRARVVNGSRPTATSPAVQA